MDPIEIKPEDIIRRPENLPPGGEKPSQGGGFNLGDVKKYIKEGKEIVEMAQEMGIDLRRFLPIGKAGNDNKPDVMQNNATPSGAQQIMNFIKFLQAFYGDITVNEALENLKRDFGELKLSQLRKQQLK